MNILTTFLDILFPPSTQQKQVRALSVEYFSQLHPPEDLPNEYIESLFKWSHPDIQVLISELKYMKNKKTLRIAGELLAERILFFLSEKQQYGSFGNPLLTPIPMHPSKKRARGWNQTELLGKKVVRHIQGLEYAPVLKKIQNSLRQTEVRTRKERMENIKGTFGVRRDVKGRNIILLDDVTTTGATLKEARSVLLDAGAQEVYAFTLAH